MGEHQKQDSKIDAATPPAPLAPIGITALRRGVRPDREWIWQGFVAPGNITLLTSQWKSGKTTLAAVLAARMGLGGSLAGRAVSLASVVIVSEESPAHWVGRDERLHFEPNVNFQCRPFLGQPSSEEWKQLLDSLEERRDDLGLELLIVDQLAAFFPGGNENSAAAVVAALTPLRPMCNRGTAVLILHHPRKGEWKTGQGARGSGALGGYVDISLEMDWFGRPDDGDRRRKLTAFSRHPETPRRLVIELNEEGTDYRDCGEFTLDDFDAGWQALFGVLDEAHNKLTRRQILNEWPDDYLKPNAATLWRWLERAVRSGRVRQDGCGRRNAPFVYWLDGIEERWKDDPYHCSDDYIFNFGRIPSRAMARMLAERIAKDQE
jgi:hypothetical protein